MENFIGQKRQAGGNLPFVAKRAAVMENCPDDGSFENPSVDIPYYKEEDFYTSGPAYHLPQLDIRKHLKSGSYFVHWSKKNGIIDGQPLPNSHQRIPATDLVQFISKLKMLLSAIGKTSFKVELDRFVNNPFAKIKDRNHQDFWYESLIETLDNSDLIFRPFKDFRGIWSIRILSPRQSETNPNWTGVCCNFGVTACKKFVEVLEKIDKEIDVAEQQRPVDFDNDN